VELFFPGITVSFTSSHYVLTNTSLDHLARIVFILTTKGLVLIVSTHDVYVILLYIVIRTIFSKHLTICTCIYSIVVNILYGLRVIQSHSIIYIYIYA